jgi:hypothetical protein
MRRGRPPIRSTAVPGTCAHRRAAGRASARQCEAQPVRRRHRRDRGARDSCLARHRPPPLKVRSAPGSGRRSRRSSVSPSNVGAECDDQQSKPTSASEILTGGGRGRSRGPQLGAPRCRPGEAGGGPRSPAPGSGRSVTGKTGVLATRASADHDNPVRRVQPAVQPPCRDQSASPATEYHDSAVGHGSAALGQKLMTLLAHSSSRSARPGWRDGRSWPGGPHRSPGRHAAPAGATRCWSSPSRSLGREPPRCAGPEPVPHLPQAAGLSPA